jgi:probable rRNA maturation factor
MNILVETGRFEGVDVDVLRSGVLRTLSAEDRDVVELSLTLLADEEIRELNRRYLGHDRPTDVIAFTLGGPEDLVGDVYVGVEQARRQAEELGISPSEELLRLAVHGTLHVLGHDHPEGEERYASPMFEQQERIVRDVLERGGM